MVLAVKISILFSGIFLLNGMLTGVWKYARTMGSPKHVAPVYVDIAHRASFLYSFAALVIAKLTEYSPYPVFWQTVLALVPLGFFSLALAGYMREGWLDRTANMFARRNFVTTWFMYGLIVGEVGPMVLILAGFVYTAFLQGTI